jgi:outer membrane protein assembly factor BamE (lipoprotein component of BamABCDE complex)
MNLSYRHFLNVGAAVMVSAALAGCSALDRSASQSEQDFGKSVRHMVDHQKANPDVSSNPDRTAIDQGDGPRLEAVLETYRGDTGQPAEVKRDIMIDISR